MFDELDPPKKAPELVFRKLDVLSVKALEEYISELENEIVRAKQEIQKRGSARSAAEAVFGKSIKD